MARIRSIKPEFFQHEAIYEAEATSGLPLRLAYIGLWTQADRRGLFRWRPRELKLNILPYDECDFGKVLDALAAGGFVERYTVDGFHFGRIPTFAKHQVFNVREKDAKNIPDFKMSVPVPCRNGVSTLPVPSGSGRDREGKGREGVGNMEGESEGKPEAEVVGSGKKRTGPEKPKHDPQTCADALCCTDGAARSALSTPRPIRVAR